MTVTDQGDARLWHAGSGEPLSPPLEHWGSVRQPTFSPDGCRVLVVSGKDARIYRLPREDRPVEDLIRLAEVLSGREVEQDGETFGFVPLSPDELRRDWRVLQSEYPQEFTATPSGRSLNRLAWQMARFPDPQFGNAERAVALASRAVEIEPDNGSWWHTLGVARYRTGDWQGALEALDKTWQLQGWATSWDWFFQAMAHWRRGNKEEAWKYYHQAVDWMENNAPQNEELIHFRKEAEQLMAPDRDKLLRRAETQASRGSTDAETSVESPQAKEIKEE